jgi:periplasmic copper chaperone A
MTAFARTAIAFLLLTTATLASAVVQEFKAGDLSIDPWSRATPKGAKVAAGYMMITNKGTAPDRLLGGLSSAAERIEVHEMAMKDGVATMRPISGGLLIEPGKSVTLAPGGNHLMIMDLKKPLKQGDKFGATLEFEKAGKVGVNFDVQAMGSLSPMRGQPGHKM